MADEILIKYKVDATELDKASVAVQDVTNETKELQTQIKATFSDKSIAAATKQLYEQGNVMGALINEYGTATSALKAMEKELATMAALGQRNTKEFKELAQATAELKDTVGDTRNEIKKMASDTKVFDTMVQGARGVAAAFSVATGLAAALGDENKDLQKTLLKVQGAMAALQGVQELANIATEKGGIATKAYGVALQVVDKISKVTGLSMAASWALATAGITVVIAGVVALIAYLQKADDESEEFAKNEEERQDRLSKSREENQKKSIKIINDLDKEFDRQQDIRRKEAFLANKDANATEIELLKEKQTRVKALLRDFNLNSIFLSTEDKNNRKKALDDMLLDVEVALKKFENLTPKVKATDELPKMLTANPLVTKEDINMTKVNSEEMNAVLRKYLYEKALSEQQKYIAAKEKLESDMWSKSFQLAQQATSAINSFVQGSFDQRLANLQEGRDRDLKNAGDDSERKKKIEQKYALESAKIARSKAIAEKTAAIFGIGISLAEAVQKIQAQAAVLAANPATAALAGNAYAQIGLAAAMAAVQIAVISAKPIPALPKFAKGGPVPLAGGRISDGHLIGHSHRDGGILINAEGGEYIWDRKTTARHNDIIKAAHENRLEDLVLHKYVAPILRAKATAKNAESEIYDDRILRNTVKETSRQSAKYIVSGLSAKMDESIRNSQRYR